MEQNTSPTSKLPILLIDTNIFGNLLDSKTVKQTFDIISELSSDYKLSISKITFQELISKGTKDVHEIIKVLETFNKFEVDELILMFAGLMTCVGIKGGFDSIIASTAFINNAGILTANQRHFPEPYFKEIKSYSISYTDIGNRTTHQMIHLLLVDINETLEKVNKIEYVQEVFNKNKV